MGTTASTARREAGGAPPQAPDASFDRPARPAPAPSALRDTGIGPVGAAPWGTHFCQFYATKDDLTELLVPYFAAGLAAGERCMWITSPPLGVQEATRALGAVVPDLEAHRRAGRLEILPHEEWYLAGGRFDQERVLRGWVTKLEEGLARGCTGLRLSGNTFWLERSDWRSFVEYEAAIDGVIARYPMLALCTYSLDRCNASEIADVIRNHQFALMKRDGRWERFESFDRRRIEDALAAERERLAAALTELREIDRRRSDFLATLSHELRNPLAPIKNALYIMRHADPGSEQARRARDIVERQADQLTRLVDDLLDVTRIARGKVELRRAPVDVAALVRGAGEDHAALFAGRGIDLEVSAPADAIWIDGDLNRLTQLVGNLLQNAARYTPRGGRAVLSGRVDGTRAEIRVRDTGAGIPPDLLDRVFEPFEQAGKGGREGGLGVGLAIVKGIAELHGGAARAESAGAGCGAEFVVSLPLAAT